ncbi:universal stress protein [Paraneptunicella aestuarii]|uniref:universal stress protein n=1 Tax=Paraneptunicella aestuarii TaxID=2831148 RepID=UPI001E5B7AA6|nr:universal stress protein [Paraneptunicella aestuarii]UAA39078.1 universal stress protein [Paraneptunicella aestuarii]
MINNILVVWEFGHHNSKLMKKSGALAQQANANVHIAAFMPENELDNPKAKDELDEAISKNFEDNLIVNLHICSPQNLVNDILNLHTEKHIDLVIKCKGEDGQLFKASDDLRLIQELTCPLLVSSNHKLKPNQPILATIDIDESGEEQTKMNAEVLAWSSYLAEKTQKDVDVVYNIPMSKAVLELDVFDSEEVLLKEESSAKKKLSETVQKHGVIPNQLHILAGDIGKNIKGMTGKIKPDLLIVGSVGRKGLKGLFIGNTAEVILKKARSDVLVVKPK